MLKPSQLLNEVTYKAVKSSGSGGQHVNKVATKVELYFNIQDSKILEDYQKEKLLEYFSSRINKDGVLMLVCGETRSQLKNKQIVIERFLEFVSEALKGQKKRILTKIPKAVKQKRLQNKRKNSEKKANRKPPSLD